MNESTNGEAAPLTGKMWLYEQPELLSKEEHGQLGLSAIERPFAFARQARWVPLTAGEIPSAQKHYPVVFTEMENPMPIAVVGIQEERNLFLDADGRWEPLTYVPAYLRCHPFAFAKTGEDKFAVVVDRAAAGISDRPEDPFFENGELTENMQALVDFCGNYERERHRTQQFCERLKELELLTTLQASQSAEGDIGGEPLARYVGVDIEKLNGLGADVLAELHADGSLAAIFGHLFSLENWGRLLELRKRWAPGSNGA